MNSEMSIYNTKLLLVFGFLLIISFNKFSLGQEANQKAKEPPLVIKAVAPIFITFVFGETGVAEAVVQVKINKEGKVTSSQIKSVTLFRDLSFEEAAKKWVFESSPNEEERTAEIKFILRIMPKGTDISDLTTIYTYPTQIEIRREVFEPRIETHPTETKPGETKKPSQSKRNKRRG